MPVRAATAAAVLGWSPVIMTGRMPAARAASTAARASGRTGSASATRPSNAGLPGGPRGDREYAVASLAQSSHHPRLSVVGVVRSSANTTSGAPLRISRSPPSTRWRVRIERRSESKGTSAVRGAECRTASTSIPAACAAAHNAPSVPAPELPARPRRVVAENARLSSSWAAGSAARRGRFQLVGVQAPPRLHRARGQSAGLVGGEEGHRAEGLHRGQRSDDRPALGHPSRAAREGQRHHSGQRLRDGRDRQADARHHGRSHGSALAAGPGRPRRQQAGHQQRQPSTQAASRRCSGVAGAACSCSIRATRPELRCRAGGHHHGAARAVHDQRPGVQHRASVRRPAHPRGHGGCARRSDGADSPVSRASSTCSSWLRAHARRRRRHRPRPRAGRRPGRARRRRSAAARLRAPPCRSARPRS